MSKLSLPPSLLYNEFVENERRQQMSSMLIDDNVESGPMDDNLACVKGGTFLLKHDTSSLLSLLHLQRSIKMRLVQSYGAPNAYLMDLIVQKEEEGGNELDLEVEKGERGGEFGGGGGGGGGNGVRQKSIAAATNSNVTTSFSTSITTNSSATAAATFRELPMLALLATYAEAARRAAASGAAVRARAAAALRQEAYWRRALRDASMRRAFDAAVERRVVTHAVALRASLLADVAAQRLKIAKLLAVKCKQEHAKRVNSRQSREREAERRKWKELRENDEEEYEKALAKRKEERLAKLLSETDQFLSTIAAQVEKLKHKKGNDEGNVSENTSTTTTTTTTTIDKNDDNNNSVTSSATSSNALHIEERAVQQPRLLAPGVQLKAYQLRGLRWLASLYANGLNGILADQMGLGKTIQTIALIAHVMEERRVPGPFLVVVPLSTVANWGREFARFAPAVRVVQCVGPRGARKATYTELVLPRLFNVLLTTYEFVQNAYDRKYLIKVPWHLLVVDEAHRLKNVNSKLSITLRTIIHCPRRFLLTGTPLQNNLQELWALLNFILPEVFSSQENFQQWFDFTADDRVVETKALAEGEENKEEEDGGGGSGGGGCGDVSSRAAAAAAAAAASAAEEMKLVVDRLHRVLRPFLLRREKKDVLNDLPRKHEVTVPCALSHAQALLYDIIEGSGGRGGRGGSGNQHVIKIASSLQNVLMQLRKCCNHPFLFRDYAYEEAMKKTGANTMHAHLIESKDHHIADTSSTFVERFDEDIDVIRQSGKFHMLYRILKKMQGANHKTLIFTQFTSVLDLMEEMFGLLGWRYYRLDGGTKSARREEMLQRFNGEYEEKEEVVVEGKKREGEEEEEEEEVNIFMLSTKAGGVGVNLQAADTVILFDTSWNPQADKQAMDRAHRIGQRRAVLVLRFVCENTVEEDIMAIASKKLDMEALFVRGGCFDYSSDASRRHSVLSELLEQSKLKREVERRKKERALAAVANDAASDDATAASAAAKGTATDENSGGGESGGSGSATAAACDGGAAAAAAAELSDAELNAMIARDDDDLRALEAADVAAAAAAAAAAGGGSGDRAAAIGNVALWSEQDGTPAWLLHREAPPACSGGSGGDDDGGGDDDFGGGRRARRQASLAARANAALCESDEAYFKRIGILMENEEGEAEGDKQAAAAAAAAAAAGGVATDDATDCGSGGDDCSGEESGSDFVVSSHHKAAIFRKQRVHAAVSAAAAATKRKMPAEGSGGERGDAAAAAAPPAKQSRVSAEV